MSAELAMVVGVGAASGSQDAAMVVVPDGQDDENLNDDHNHDRHNSALIAATAAAAAVMSLAQGSGRAGSSPRKRSGHAVNGITKRSNSGTGGFFCPRSRWLARH